MVVLSKPWSVNRRRAISSSSRRLVPGGRPRRVPASASWLPVNTVCLLRKSSRGQSCLCHKVTLTCDIYSSLRDGNRAHATIVHVCAARESAMSERVATADITEAPHQLAAEPQAAEPELAVPGLLLGAASIDGRCGVYRNPAHGPGRPG